MDEKGEAVVRKLEALGDAFLIMIEWVKSVEERVAALEGSREAGDVRAHYEAMGGGERW